MRFPFKSLPRLPGDRPVVEFAFEKFAGQKLIGLVDTGSWNTRVDEHWADELGIDLTGVDYDRFEIAGRSYASRAVLMRLVVGKASFNCDVNFTAGWNYTHQILGMKGFFDTFVVRIDATDKRTDLTVRRYT
jgi:predicted aspartyl protease